MTALRLTPEEEINVLRAFAADCEWCEGRGKRRMTKRVKRVGRKGRVWRQTMQKDHWCARCGVAIRLADRLEQIVEGQAHV